MHFPNFRFRRSIHSNASALLLSGACSLLAPHTSAQEMVTADTPLNEIRKIHDFFSDEDKKVQMLAPSERTLYAWQNMSRFFRTAQILRAGSISDLPENLQPSIGDIEFTREDGSVSTVNEQFENYPMDGLIVVKDGEILFEHYKTMREFDKHNWYSSGKILGSTLLALLEEEGKVDITNPVSTYIPELQDSVWDTVPVEHALDMATGLDSTELDEPAGDSRTNPEQGWYRWVSTMGLLDNPLGLEETPLEVLSGMTRRMPGYEVFEYNSINTFVVDVIVENVSGKPLPEYLSERIWRKAGMEHDAFVAVSDDGLPASFGVMNSTLRDMARFGMLFTPSWSTIADEQIISDAIIQNIQTGGDPAIYQRGYLGELNARKGFPEDENIANRYQWDAVFEDGDFWKKGVGAQGLYISPSRNLVIAYFSTGSGDDQEETMARAIAKQF
ncbi:MAG: serine hydrolase domain-containing protein [Ruegeria sp.]|uniref:serine hydrolase domain-containing protein n=1 Tax=Ruegeria sp. TaxID=1879320 RepID=UPI00349EB287